ncbi:DUF58 domain-containing protein [Marinomonas sp. 2405UD68-3]|uniref:DUF58 domain-containing protein n=1 Tax=Marinomonas sp. 2405UD68-3 TaxID=3391835 RepID=UPI0039C90510
MDFLISPDSPILASDDLIALAPYAKHLGKAPKKTHHTLPNGQHQRQVKGHGIEMLELRQYQMHDELRHIDWRVTARTGEAHTRIYAQESENKRLLILDISGLGYFGTQHTFISTRMVQVACIIAWRTQIKKDNLGYCLSYGAQTYQRSATHNKKSFSLLMSQLADATNLDNRDTPISTEAWELLHHSKSIKQQNIIILSDRLDLPSTSINRLSKLAKHNHIHWINIIDENAQKLPKGQYLMEDKDGVKWLSVSKKSQHRLKEQSEQRNALLKKQLNSFGMTLHSYNLSESPITIARNLLTLGVIN